MEEERLHAAERRGGLQDARRRKRRKREYRETQSKLKVWEKGAGSYRRALKAAAAHRGRSGGETENKKAKVKGEGQLAKQPDALQARRRKCMAISGKKKNVLHNCRSMSRKKSEAPGQGDAEGAHFGSRGAGSSRRTRSASTPFLKENDKRAHDGQGGGSGHEEEERQGARDQALKSAIAGR